MSLLHRLAPGSTYTVTAPDLPARVLADELAAAGLSRGKRARLAVTVRLLADDAERRQYRADYGLTVPRQPESFGIAVRQVGAQVRVDIAANDDAGLLFGLGRFLRACGRPAEGGFTIPAGLNLTAHPWHPPVDGQPAMRGAQVTTEFCRHNADNGELERYLRELALWGCNWLWMGMGEALAHAGSSPEAIARAEANAAMLNRASALAARYGMKVGLQVAGQRIEPSDVRPEMLSDGTLCPSRPETRQAQAAALDAAYARLERVDAVFTASGDPGGCRCDLCRPWPATYLRMTADQAAALRRHHPAAAYFVSNQQMVAEENDLFLDLLAKEQPDWLTGVLWGPQGRSLPELRERLPERYRVLLYPDTTHAAVCQHPVEGWEKERALLFERRSPNHRPLATRQLWEATKLYCEGSKPYSEGVQDDLNKAVWLGSQWCVTTPQATMPIAGPEPVGEIVHQYARRHFGPEAEELAAEAYFALEENWSTPLLGNPLIAAVHDALRCLEAALPADRQGWRWEMLAIRAELDRWLELKVAADRRADERALAALAGVGEVADRVRAARRRLARRPGSRELQALAAGIRGRRDRILELVHRRLAAADRLDRNYANRAWLLDRLQAIEQAPAAEQEHLVADTLAHADPGPGGWYDDCGNVTAEPHLASGEDYMHDDFEAAHRLSADVMSYGRMEWDADIVYFYDDLDPAARYQVEVTYLTSRRMPSTQVLLAGGRELHGPLALPHTPERHVFALPPETYAGGELELRFRRVSGRGPLVSEIWLRRVAAGE